ncbi:MAG: phosphoribosylformylglycinamidine synthase [Haloferula sp.]
MHRIFVEKKPAFAHEANSLLPELRESLHLDQLEGLRVIQRYDVDGLTDREFELATASILSEPQTDEVSRTLGIEPGDLVFAVEYLPGQFDQRADSAAQCIQILTTKERPAVASAKLYVLQGDLSPSDLDRIKDFVINSVDSHEADLALPETLDIPTPTPKDVESLDEFNSSAPEEVCKSLGLAMSPADVAFCQDYFGKQEGRAPTLTEIRVLDTYWSDHCRHTTFLTRIADVEFAEQTEPVQRAWETYQRVRTDVFGPDTERPMTLMDIALMGMRELRKSGELDNLEESDEINAASIVVPVEIKPTAGSSFSETKNEEWLVMFKNETHNHPTEIEPFGGAATCLGGCIRDPLSGRSYVYQAMRVTGAANPLTPFDETLPGKLPQKKICQIAAEGYSSYGNQIGLATGQVAEVYHPGYVAKRMEIGAVVAAAPRSQVFRGSPANGDLILLIGGRTGRDGVGGATGSSKEHGDDALENSAEVQKGDAPTERKIQRLFRNPELARKIKVCNDFGAGGVSVAIGEIAPSLDINLDAVPKKYDGLDGTELAISESQERMAVCVDPSEMDFFIRESDKENLDCTHVATVADHGRLRLNWRGQTIVDLSREFLDSNGVQQDASIRVEPIPDAAPEASPEPEGSTLAEQLKHRLSQLNQASQKGLGEIFDGSVGAGTVLWPFGGSKQLTPPDAMVAKLPLLEGDTDACSYMSWGFNPHVSKWSPFHGAAWAVTESVCKAVAAGARLSDVRLTLQEYFPKLGGDPSRWGMPLASLLGAFEAQHKLRLAAIGGKDSMSGSFNELDVPPTLVSFALAPGHASRARSPEFKQAGSKLSLVEVALTDERLPNYERLLEVAELLHGANPALISVKSIGAGGLGHALATCCFGNDLGATIASAIDLFTPRPFSFLIEHSEELPPALEAQSLGTTTADGNLKIGSEEIATAELLEAWTNTLEPVYPTEAAEAAPTDSLSSAKPSSIAPAKRIGSASAASPRVIIPAFPGTNSEYDTAKAFAEAGATPSIQVFRNLTPQALDESLKALAASIRSSEILMIPGGFSAGDEPDGSAKFIATVLRNPEISEAVMDLIKNRDGLILGICNGFQALVKTGLVPFGEIREPSGDAPTLAHNTIGRHVSCYVHTRVESKLSPWLANTEVGDLHRIPVSHGEGRFIATDATIRELAQNGQIATRYVDAAGQPSMEIEFNPNGSAAAIEGITSPCGRIYGKMGHTERRGTRVASNIPGDKHQPLFKAGVRWFQS